jgi:hypothetical protein
MGMSSVSSPVKVIYIAGFERSGSTLLTKVLGELDDTFAAGELRGIWHCSYRDNQDCGCGSTFRDCDLWQQVTNQAFGNISQVDYQWMIDNRPKRRHTAIMLMPGGRRIIERQFREYIQKLEQLYHSLADVTGNRIIVDSSKTPLYGYVLGLAPSIEVYVLHLVRDPRGTQASNLRRAKAGHKQLQNYSAARSSILWNMLHVTQELFARGDRSHYMRLRYEDFIEDPIGAIEQIKSFIHEPNIGVPQIDGEQIMLSPNHTVSGNRNRIVTGAVPLRIDDRWRTELDAQTRTTVTRLTLPLLRRYRYAP